jgi:hypothetical protein
MEQSDQPPRLARKAWLAPLAERIMNYELFADRLGRLLAKMEKEFFRHTRGYAAAGCVLETPDLPLFLHEYLAYAVLRSHGTWRLDDQYDPNEVEDDPAQDGRYLGYALRLMDQDVQKAFRHWKTHGAIPSSSDDEVWAHDGIAPAPESGNNPWRQSAEGAALANLLNPDSVLEDAPLCTVLRWFKRTAGMPGFDPFAPDQTAEYGVGSTPRELHLVTEFAASWRLRQVSVPEDQGQIDRLTALRHARRQFADKYKNEHAADLPDGRPQEVVQKSLTRGLRRIRKMLYVLGGLGPEGALLADDACDAAVALYVKAFKPAHKNTDPQLRAQRQLLDRAVEATVRTMAGARVQASDFAREVADDDPAVAAVRRSLGQLDGSATATETLHLVEHKTATSLTRQRPDCVMGNGCAIEDQPAGGKELA